MLRSLTVRDYALIDELEVAFDSGLNVITGETGAGKSILLGALSMILGERASPDVVRGGARKAVIEGHFDEADGDLLRALLSEHGIDEMGKALILRREISASGSRAFVNDTPATLAVMRAFAANLIDLHGQHEHQSLLRTETHLSLVDGFGSLGAMVATYRRAYDRVAEVVRERKGLVARERELRQQKDLYGFQIEEIDRVAPQPGEDEEIEAERSVLENAERLAEATGSLHAVLYEADEAVNDQLVVVRNELMDLARIDRDFEEPLAEIKAVLISVAEVATFLQAYNARIEYNPERLDRLRERAAEIEMLKRKYGGTLDAAIAHRRDIGTAYGLAADFEGAIERLTEQAREAQRALGREALRLSERRKAVAARIATAIEAELRGLGMAHARFEVRFAAHDDPQGWIRLPAAEPSTDATAGGGGAGDGAAVKASERRLAATPTGMDAAEFYITTNAGEPPRPLARVASGGEVSRVMLAIKTVLAKAERMPILVFDEIDTGISGATARKVGEAMHDLAQYHQIVAITHLPQIAALGDVHFKVEKTVADGRTRTGLRRLSGDEREGAVAQLLAGDTVTDAALTSARELMRRR